MRILFLTITMCWISVLSAQQIADSVYWVYFTDKENNGFEVARPEDFLSERSIERRAWQGLGVDLTDEPVTQAYVDEISAMGIEIRHISRWLNGFAMVNADRDQYEQVLARSFTGTDPWEPESDELYFPTAPSGNRFEPPLPTPPGFSYGVATEQINLMNMDLLHELGYTGKGVWVAVLDAGFRNVDSLPSFTKLIDEGRLMETRNFVDDRSVYRLPNSSGNNHGMYVLSIMAAEWDGYMVGSAPHASYILCMTENPDQETRIEEIAWIEAAEYIDSLGFDVINTSLGYSDFDGTEFDYTYRDMDGRTTFISRAASLTSSKGIIACNSAGNSGDDSWYYITAPADAFNILCVGAVDSTGQIASFSSRGPTNDERIKPDVSAMGVATGVQSSGGGLARGGGTSFSSPLIAGSVASLWQAYPDVPARELMRLVRQSGDRLKNPDSTFGFGVPDFYGAYLSNNLGKYIPERLEIYPNPTGPMFMVRIPDTPPGIHTLNIFDVAGRTIHTGSVEVPGEVWLPESMRAGFYLVEIRTARKVYRSRLIKE